MFGYTQQPRKENMKTFNKKKDFTIVELVIVVAVIGVLTAVLVPTFVNLVNKANQAADESLVKNLNTALRMSEAEDGKKNANLTAALSDTYDAGYVIQNLTPHGNKDIVWNQDNDEFSLLEAAPSTDAYKYWKVYNSYSDIDNTYSAYLNDASYSGDVDVSEEGHAGKIVVYTASSTVVVRDTSGTLIDNVWTAAYF